MVEGIHGLNPRLVPSVPPERMFRVYISALTQLNIDRYNRVPTTDNRLLRRIVRDARARGYTAADTIGRWESVHRGERDYIFPYQENADVMFNSALVYELAALKPLAEPLLLQIEPGQPGHMEARRLLAFLQWFSHPCQSHPEQLDPAGVRGRQQPGALRALAPVMEYSTVPQPTLPPIPAHPSIALNESPGFTEKGGNHEISMPALALIVGPPWSLRPPGPQHRRARRCGAKRRAQSAPYRPRRAAPDHRVRRGRGERRSG